MKRLLILIIATALLLTGCSGWLDGNYVSVTPHQEQTDNSGSDIVSVTSYNALRRALENLVRRNKETGVISVAHYDQLTIAKDTRTAIQRIMAENPFANYAVESIDFELGTNAGEPALAIHIQYIHGKTDPSKIQSVSNLENLQSIITNSICSYYSGLVIHVAQYQQIDIDQLVADYCLNNPHKVIEQPQVTASFYPQEGTGERIVELKFTYQYSRDTLREMQSQVSTVCTEIKRTVTESAPALEKYQQIFQTLQQLLGEYKQETSITPAYSFLLQSTGDSRAAATVYAALCRQSGLECQTITGSYNAEPWNWNILSIDGIYYYFDFLRCCQEGTFQLLAEEEMAGYVWYSSADPFPSAPENSAE